jgi:ligand-binding sensor domain-containing protein/signal transduction histidine kinase/DNA-binding response OmpR family regulator
MSCTKYIIRMIIRPMLLLILLLASAQLRAQLNYSFRYLTIAEGLPQNTVNSILKDSFGFMWFATGNGLSRYDGYDFVNFTKPSLPGNLVNGICESPDKKLWIGTSEGLAYYDLTSETIQTFPLLVKNNKIVNVITLFCDEQNRVWVGTTSHGLFLLTPQGDSYLAKHFTLEDGHLPGNYAACFLQTKDGRILVGTNHGIAVYDKQRESFYLLNDELLQNAFVQSLFESMDGDLWVGTYNGVWVSNQITGRDEWYFSEPFSNNGLSHNRINSIVQDFRGNIYLGTLGGVNLFIPQSNSFISLPNKGENGFSLNSIFIKCLYIDDKGNVWIGTEKGGVNQFSLHQKPFHFISHEVNNANSLSNRTVNAILTEGDNLWIGTAGGGLNKLNRKTGRFSHFMYNPSSRNAISSNYVTSLLLDAQKNLWVGTWGGGICKMKSDGTFQSFIPHVADAETNFQNAFVSSILYVNPGFLFIGTEGGLSVLNLKTEEFVQLNQPNNSLAIISEIGCMIQDRDGYIWIGTRTGLFRFKSNKLNLPFNAIFPEEQLQVLKASKPYGIPGNYVTSLLEDMDGHIWVGTSGDGLARGKKAPDSSFVFEHFSRKDGLSNDVIYAIQQDNPGYIWVSTDYGLSRINPNTISIDNYFAEDGLLNDQFYWSASHKSEAGELFFGTINGLNHFFPSTFPTYPYKPEITITAVRVLNDEIKQGERRNGRVVLSKSLNDASEIHLSYKDNVFSLDFSALDFFHPKKTKYAYMLEGVDRNWVEVSSAHRWATYTNLKGGKYVFRVKAAANDGVWSDKERVITVVIHPPFWRTAWFIAFVTLLLVIGTFFYIKHHTKRLLLEKSRLETMVHERTKKVEEQRDVLRNQAVELKQANSVLQNKSEQIEGQKVELEQKNAEIIMQRDILMELNKEIERINQTRLRFFTNISHEFRTPLTLIISPVERILKEMNLPSAAHALLVTVQRNARRLNLLIDQLLMFRKIETGNLSVRVVCEDISLFITDVFNAFDVLAKQRNINYSLVLEIDNAHRWFDSEKVENILYNLLSNAFKYTPMGGQITVGVSENSFVKNGEVIPAFNIEVSDSGMGINESETEQIFKRFYRGEIKSTAKGSGIGLSLTRELTDALGGTIAVEKNEGGGAIFIVTLPSQKEDIPNAQVNEIPVYDTDELENKVQVVFDNLIDEEPVFEREDVSHKQEASILVVEDNKELAMFIANSLSGSYNVSIAENGKVGYELARKNSPDLVISDVMMPVMDGIEMCKQIKNNLYTSHIPVIMLSAKALLEDQLEGIKIGADDYVSKPFNLELLLAKVHNAIDLRRKMKSLFTSTAELTLPNANSETLDDKFLAKAYSVLEISYSNPEFSVEVFADQMFVSRSLLYKKLKALVDLSPNDFITVYRLKKALPMLANKDMSVNEVAYNVGFNDPKYFSRVFKKFYKKTPSEYYG